MKTYQFRGILQKDGWNDDVQVSVDQHGVITAIGKQLSTNPEYINGYALPGFQNAHSHAFQYAMAGLAEVHAPGRNPDDFWSWREAMYSLALTVNPDQMQSIATMLYAEMVRHGYTHVAEFHYLHHTKTGAPYEDLAEMGKRLIAAARTAGIHITLVPIFYQKGGFDKAPAEGQRRFISKDTDAYYRLLEASKAACHGYHGANVAVGIHSMRGVEPALIAEIAERGPQDLPFHIHIAEQLKEIEDCRNYLGKRPVEWLLDNVQLNERFQLVHATHLTPEETRGIARSGANVVLCPTTEGNLGDGIFPLRDYQALQGKWSIGTDSHIGLNPLEELRLLDYGQRLISHQRNTFAGTEGDSGRFAIEMALLSGRKAMNNYSEDFFVVGKSLDTCILDADAPLLRSTSSRIRTSAMLYSCDTSHHLGTMIDGQLHSKGARHIAHDTISADFEETMKYLGSRQ